MKVLFEKVSQLSFDVMESIVHKSSCQIEGCGETILRCLKIGKEITVRYELIRRVAGRYLKKNRHLAKMAATTELPDKFPPSEIGLMTKNEFLQFRNPRTKYHHPQAYTFTLDSLNRDYSRHPFTIMQHRGEDIQAWEGDRGYLFYEGSKRDGNLIGVLHNGVLYHSDRNIRRMPRLNEVGHIRWYVSENTRKLPTVNKTKLVKYLSDVAPLVHSSAQRRLDQYPYLYQRIKIKGEPFTVRFEETPELNRMIDMAVFNEESKIVAVAQNEWGATLLGVAEEYRGKGLGKYIGSVWYKLNPESGSGGFTQAGEANALRIWNRRVRDFLAKGWYSDLVRSGRLSRDKLKNILSDLDSRGQSTSRLPSDSASSSKTPKRRLLLHVDYPTFILYDQAFLELEDPYSVDLEPYIYGYGFFRGSGDKSFLFRLDYDKPFRKLVTSVALQMARDEGHSIYNGEGYSDILELEGLPNVQVDGDYINLTKDVLPLNRLGQSERTLRRKHDSYDEKKVLLYETADAKW